MADPETRFLGLGKPGRREQPAHESLSSRATLVEVPLTGLSFIQAGCRWRWLTGACIEVFLSARSRLARPSTHDACIDVLACDAVATKGLTAIFVPFGTGTVC